jgi:hypothetical protein
MSQGTILVSSRTSLRKTGRDLSLFAGCRSQFSSGILVRIDMKSTYMLLVRSCQRE